MKKIWSFLKVHFREDYHPQHYLAITALLTTAISLNYLFSFEENHLEQLTGFGKFGAHFLLYATLYFASVWSFSIWYQRRHIFASRDFWIHSLFGLAILALDSSVPFLRPFVHSVFPAQVHHWGYKVAINMVSFLTVFLPVLIFYLVRERSQGNIYGLKPKQFDYTPYLMMLLIMLPLIVLASFHKSFLNQYPMYSGSLAHHYLGVNEWITVAGYELAYGLDFVTVEFLFRGFFVLGMMSFLGRGSVLCMAVVYCSLHFGKPMGEAISSVFGGYILGVIAYETSSIWGGIIVHVGIAWMMETVAYLHRL